ncbi:MAG TPA: TraB/GumN family protein [Flavisolibacter sp.]|nr:TraB/GumN family protein [Flavisolibacter sp.]
MRKLLSGIALIFFSLPALAQDRPGTLLWEVTMAGQPYRSYLFGTFHEVTPAFFASLPVASRKLDSASLLFVESLDTAQQSFSGHDAISGWSEQEWKALLSLEQQEVFMRFVKQSNNPGIYRYAPSILFLSLFRIYAQNFCDTTERDSNELMDSYITRFFLRQEKPVIALDEDQAAVLSGSVNGDSAIRQGPYAAYCINFMNLMLASDDSECRLIKDYKDLNLDYALDRELRGFDNLFTERNRRWCKTLTEAFNRNNCFVAVGFRHLFYKEGLIQQLRQKGYTVQPIPVK